MTRPLVYDPALCEEICGALVEAPVGLKKILADERFPSAVTFYRWLGENAELQNMYARARELQADALFDETLDIADESKEDYVKRLGYNGADPTWEINGEAIQRSRLRIDTRKWMAAKLRPKKYGDQIKVDQTIEAGDGLRELLEAVNGQTRSLQALPKPDDDSVE